MKIYKYITPLFLLLLLFGNISYGQTVSANATRPSATDNAFLTHPKYVELEAGLGLDENFLYSPLLFKIGLDSKVELGLIMNNLFVTRLDGGKSITQIGDPGVQLKYQFMKSNEVAFAGVVKTLLTKNEETPVTVYLTPSIMMPVGQLDATAGFTHLAGTNTIHYAAAFSPNTSLPVGLYLEFFGDKTKDFTFHYFDAGVSYSPQSTLVFDMAIILGLGDNTQSWILQAGFTHTLGKIF